ncbi:MAG: glutamine--fructose-6-phosphate transaminase (isomerizing) [Thiolinea sp.]
MCGIIAYTGHQNALPILMSGLRRLEYRGYDSSGIAVIQPETITTCKAAGKLAQLEARLPDTLDGTTGIGHTRWATHGRPDDTNAHPHSDNQSHLALVHNGIIENADALREQLQAAGHTFTSETDTEVLVCLIADQQADSLLESVRGALSKIRGTYGIAVISCHEPDTLIAARNGSPVILGVGDGEMLVASDVSALLRHTREVVHLDDGEIAELTPQGFRASTLDAHPASKTPTQIEGELTDFDRGGYPHFMLKEIMEQPEAIRRTLSGRLDERFATAHLGGLNLEARDLLDVQRIKILGCGTAYYAGCSGAEMIESLARLPASAEPAAEFRYRNPVIEKHTLYIVVSQSGETFDTLAAVAEIKRKGGRVLGVVNSVGSTIARAVDGGIYMHAGPEVSVASTKAYSCMLVCFALLALHLARIRDLSPLQGRAVVSALNDLPLQIQAVLEIQEQINAVARRYTQYRSMFYIGRTDAYPMAQEGALKLKEVSYIHAEAYPASELKHGPLALVCADMPVAVALPDNDLLDKSMAALEEVKARQGRLLVFTNAGDARIDALADDVIRVPSTHPMLHPLLLGVAMQLFAYYCAVELEQDVDQPRNLAKSVTVE